MTRKIVLLAFLTLCYITGLSFSAHAGVRGSKHDFSTTGTSNYSRNFKLPSGQIIDEVCVFCHTPHGSSTVAAYRSNGGTAVTNQALWNRTMPVSAGALNDKYTLYSSTTLTRITLAAPTGASLMCLSCHDGVTSIAVGNPSSGNNVLLNGPGPGNPIIDLSSPGLFDKVGDIYNNDPLIGGGWGANIGGLIPGSYNPATDRVDLSNDHPVSFAWRTGIPGIWSNAPRDTRLKLFGTQQIMECTTCHNVHDNTFPPFLVMSNGGSAMCFACHDK
jgi:predicted CXXCH cytochrome family protein